MSPFAPYTTIFLYGLAGSGKTYVGDLLAKQTGVYHYHADDDITEEMKQALAECRPFTNAMRDDYFRQLIVKIQQLQQQHSGLIISQAAYKQRHRDWLTQQVDGLLLVQVVSDDQVIEQRLKARQQGASAASVAALKQDFESPPSGSPQLINNQTKISPLAQLQALISTMQR